MVDRLRSPQPPKAWQNIVIVTFLVLVTIDSFPSGSRIVKSLQSAIDPIMDYSGLWQHPWDLYAPNVDRGNVWVEARLYVEGESDYIEWRSPHWRSLNCYERFINSREIEYYDRIRFNSSAAAQPSFAHYLIRDFQSMHPNAAVSKIELISVSENTPAPENAGSKPEAKRILFYTLELE